MPLDQCPVFIGVAHWALTVQDRDQRAVALPISTFGFAAVVAAQQTNHLRGPPAKSGRAGARACLRGVRPVEAAHGVACRRSAALQIVHHSDREEQITTSQ